MDELSRLILNKIKERYHTVTAFCEMTGIPRSSMARLLKEGPGGMAFAKVARICGLLGISHPLFGDSGFAEFLRMYSLLDDTGRHTVETVLRMEYGRCTAATGAAEPDKNESELKEQ